MNLIILSDHGMDTVTYDRIIYLDDYVSNKTYKAIVTGPNASIRPNICKYYNLKINVEISDIL